ncbi:DNA mismatch repair endonuclease MutL [Lacticaseibacillus porcinae]|uniref:DNA mismatch repair endonuclease MutL n=1 Tax=Lacticaseibacillus porcinae TaxID=1123687 RepID=UPI000F76D054|nr:DNA mismatch repair endonuclease MutL [Lacticaseibacillus porcinae]
MPKIHQLSPTLSNQIAAGEVIERPASVVKELVENSIDAKSSQIDINLKDAGITMIQVLDNGMGIDEEDVPTAFLPHATSKILTVKDLFNVHSLGFRGEALASIAAVADVTLETATASGLGTIAHIVGGKMENIEKAGSRKGTQITVRDLFFNTPARLKYVKSQATELGKIVDIVNRLALAHPEIAFSLRHQDKMVLKTAGHGDLQQTLAGIYGVATAKGMLSFEGEDDDFKISGYFSLPDTTRASRNYLSLMINGRYIKNYQLTKAIIAGYGSKLMVGRYPIAVVNIEMAPLLVDVNVHPTKQEVRLSKEDQLARLLTQTIKARLSSENLIPEALHNLRQRPAVNMEQLTQTLNDVQRQFDVPTPQPSPQVSASAVQPTPQPVRSTSTPQPQATEAVPAFGKSMADLDGTPIFKDRTRLAQWDEKYAHDEATADAEPDLSRPEPTKRFPDLRYLAQVHGTYLLAEDPDGLYLLDQHAAQERVNYEYYRQKIGEVATDLQRLLVPIVLDYPASDAIAIKAAHETLESLGLYLEDFGQNTFIVRQHPTWFKAGQEEDTIREMVDWVLKDGHLTVAAFREKTAIMMSCKRAIKANHHLDGQQAQALLVKLAQCENPFNCPHGRPVLVHFSNTDLEKMFKRIQDSHTTEDF